MNDRYVEQFELLLDVLPVVMLDDRFALKGGTALNLFYRNMPRLSVDIDLCWLPIEDRPTTYRNINEALIGMKNHLMKLGFHAQLSNLTSIVSETKLFVRRHAVVVKIEPNYIMRGAVFLPEKRTATDVIADKWRREIDALCLNFAELMGGKICAALNRQHPRDLFDIKYFLEHEKFTERVKKAFLVCLISHQRPIHEVLDPNMKDISTSFQNWFRGMTDTKVTLEDLHDARLLLLKEIRKALTDRDKKFLIGFKSLKPNWSLLQVNVAPDLPAVQWKMLNLRKMTPANRRSQLHALEKVLELG